MKMIIIALIAMASLSAFAAYDGSSCTTVFGQRVCGVIERIGNDLYISNFEQDVPASKAAATRLCQAAGVEMRHTKVKFKTKKSASGEKVLSQVKCKYKQMSRCTSGCVGSGYGF